MSQFISSFGKGKIWRISFSFLSIFFFFFHKVSGDLFFSFLSFKMIRMPWILLHCERGHDPLVNGLLRRLDSPSDLDWNDILMAPFFSPLPRSSPQDLATDYYSSQCVRITDRQG